MQVSVEETGKVSLLCEREGKVLKSVPAKYKKDETVVACQKVCKEASGAASKNQEDV